MSDLQAASRKNIQEGKKKKQKNKQRMGITKQFTFMRENTEEERAAQRGISKEYLVEWELVHTWRETTWDNRNKNWKPLGQIIPGSYTRLESVPSH